jgi:hypothetical protein
VPYRFSKPFTGDLGKMHDVAAFALLDAGEAGCWTSRWTSFQGRFLNRSLPARTLLLPTTRPHGLAAAGSNVRSIEAALNAAGYLTVSTTGTWSTSTVTSLLGSDTAPVRRTDGGVS